MATNKAGAVPGYGSMRNPGGRLVAALVTEWFATLRASEPIREHYLPLAYLIPPSSAGAWAPMNAAVTILQHDWTQKRKACRVQLVELDDARWAVMHSRTLSGGFIEEVTLARAIPLDEFAESFGDPTSYKDRRSEAGFFGVGPILHRAGKEAYVLGRAARCFPVEGFAAGTVRRIFSAPRDA